MSFLQFRIIRGLSLSLILVPFDNKRPLAERILNFLL